MWILALVVLVALCDAKDTPYLQEASFQQPYAAAANPFEWDVLPFTITGKGDFTKRNTLISTKSCMIILNDGKLYGTAEIQPAKPLYENPYGDWKVLGDQGSGLPTSQAVLYAGSSKNGTLLYTATSNNIAEIWLSEGTEDSPCGKVHSSRLLLDEDRAMEWGSVTGMQYAQSMDVLFVGSVDKGVFLVNLRDSAVEMVSHVGISGESSTTMLWVDKWNTLFTANDVAFYTLKFCTKMQKIVNEDHEWIGGILAFTPTDLDYDEENDLVWIAEKETIHKLTQDGTYWRMGYQQAAPMVNISSVAVKQGQVFSGSINLGAARVNGKQSAAQLDVSVDANTSPAAEGQDGDPWSWLYYFGPRWLPSNDIYAIIPTSQAEGSSVLVVTSAGLTFMNVGQMTLEEKAKVQESFQEPRHDRHGLSTEVSLDTPGVLSSYHKSVGDNDGLWTSMSAMGQTYRYMATKNEDARANAWRMFEGLELLSKVTGAYPHFTARSFSKLSDGDAGLPAELDPNCVNDCWYASPMEGWWYKGDTSSDELCGHMAIYPMLYDHVAKTPDEKERVLKLLDGIMSSIVENDLYFIQPATNKRTLWGFWNPRELNDEPEHYSERGTNSLEILAWLTQIYSVTGNERYREVYWKLVNEHKYVQNTVNVKIDSAIDENHSDTELIMLAFHALFYSYERLPADHERKAAVWDMVEPMIPSLQRTFVLLKGELNPLWLGIYAGTAAQRRYVNEKDFSDAAWTLRHWQMDNINWNIQGDQRIDLDIAYTFLVRLSTDKHIMRHIRPPQERQSSEWNNDPFAVDPSSAATTEFEPGTYLLPYYIMLYHGFI